MRACCLFLLAPFVAGAQFPAPQQPGVLLERDLNVDSGELAVRAPDNQVYRYRFDPKTVVHRDTFAGGMGHLRLGDQVNVESEPVAGSLLRYAKTIWVSDSPDTLNRPEDLRRGIAFPLLDLNPRTGNLTFSGVVARLNGQSLVLRTREGEQILLIRRDTRYVANGDTVEAARLQPNMRVFVRAGRNLYEQVEAYQVIWGSILVPAHR
ncbi:MAG TPA: hypothetical protein VMB03_06780 [Bryobacteraceae bacterium]|nr:hypothetical protein [Bryobacteraceae bacterium]